MITAEHYKVDSDFLTYTVTTMVLSSPTDEMACLTESLIVIKTLFGKDYGARNYYRQMLAILHFNSMLWD